MNIIFVTGSLPPIKCGVGIYSKVYLEHLIASGIKVNLITSQGVEEIKGVNSTYSVRNWAVFRLPNIIGRIKKIKSNIVHIQYPAVGYKRNLGINLLPLCLRLFTHKKIIITLHEYYASRKIGRIRNFITCILANEVVVSNQADLDALPRIIKKKTKIIYIASNIAVVPNDKQKWHELLKDTGLAKTKNTLLFFGFPHVTKNLAALIEAVAELDSFQLMLLSDLKRSDEYENSILDLAEKLPGKVGIGGFRDDPTISIALQNADYFILPQFAPLTPKSSTALAALVHGTPIISTKATKANINAPFVDMVNCYLIDLQTPGSIVSVIKKAESNYKLKGSILKNADQLAINFTWDYILDAYTTIYSKEVSS